jgi:hypothetical protein
MLLGFLLELAVEARRDMRDVREEGKKGKYLVENLPCGGEKRLLRARMVI